MALAFLADSNPAFGTSSVTPDPVTDVTPIEGDHAFIAVSWKRAGATLATPAGWALIASATVGTGTPGAGDGPIELRVYYRQVPSGGLSLPTLTMGGDSTGRIVQAGVIVYRGDLATGGAIDYAATSGSDTTDGSAWSVTGGADIGIQTGDALLCFGAITDGTSTTLTSPTLTTPGLGAYTSTGNPFSTSTGTGDRLRSYASRGIAPSGSSAGAPAFNATIGGTAGRTGGAIFLRLREQAVAPPEPPGPLFDLDNWKLTLPTDGADGGTNADEIVQPALETYADTHFRLDDSNRMRMVAPAIGATTSGSDGTRSELRETEDGVEADWTIATSSYRRLTVTGIWDPTSITGGTGARQEVIIGQIHGTTGTPPLYLAVEHTTGTPGSSITPRLRLFTDAQDPVVLLPTLTASTEITYRIEINKGRCKVWAGTGGVANLPANPQLDEAASWFNDNTGCYLKVGSYNKTTVASGSSGEAIATITHLELIQSADTRRFYLANAAPAYSPGTAAGFWDDTTAGLATPHQLSETRAGAGASTARAETSTDAAWFVLLGQWISAPAASAGTILGSAYEIAAAWLESNPAAEFRPTVNVWVTTGSTNVPRATAISQFINNREMPDGTPAGLQYSLSAATSGAFQPGDRIVVDLGYRSHNTDDESFTGTLYYGGTGTPDMADGVTTLTRPGWIDLTITPPGIVFDETAVPLGRTGETSSARAVTAAKQRQLAAAASTDAARALAPGKASTLGRIAETDGTRPIAAGSIVALGQAAETAGARPLAAAKSTTLGPAGALDAARTLTVQRTATLAAAGETDGAGPLVENRGLVAAAETSSARPLTPGKIYALGRAGDTTGTRALNTYEIGRPSTLDGLRPWSAAKQTMLAPATDLGGHARQLLPGKTYVLGRAGEVEQARELAATAIARQALTLALWAVDPDDGRLIPLPHHTKLSVSPVVNSQGSISVEYPAYGRNAHLLRQLADDDRDLEVEIWLHGSREGALRGLLSSSSSDDTDEQAVNGYSGTLLEQLLDEVLLWPQETDEKKELSFVAANAGEMAATVLEQAQARGCLVGVTRDFTTGVDSTGTAWPTTTTVRFSPTGTFLAMLQELVELGLIEAFELTADRVLRLWGPGQHGVDRTFGEQPLTFRRGRDLTEAPLRHNVRPAGTTVLAVGAEGNHASATDPTALARRGRRIEVATTANALKDEAAVAAFAQQSLPTATAGTREVAHGLVVGPGRPRPRKDFERGDWVRSDTAGRIERRRIWQWTLVEDVSGLDGELVVGTPVTDHLQVLARQLKRISSGTAVVGTSQPSPTEDTTPPAAPTGLVAESIAYQDPSVGPGQTLAMVTVGWNAVTTNADGSDSPLVQAAQLILDMMEELETSPPDPEDPDPVIVDPDTWTWKGCPQLVQDFAAPLRALWVADGSPAGVETWLMAYVAEASGTPTAADDIAGYRVRYSYLGLEQVGGLPSSDPFPEEDRVYYEATPSGGTSETQFSFANVEGGSRLRIEVAAFDRFDNLGAWADVDHDTSNDDTAPPVASAPTLKTWFRTLDVSWDGLGAEGEPMPIDFAYARVWVGQGAGLTLPGTIVGPVPFDPEETAAQYVRDIPLGAGTVNIPDLPVGVGYYAALQPVDQSGNASALSAIVGPVTAQQLVTIDIGPDAISRAQIIDGEIVRAKIADAAINSAKIEELQVGKLTSGTMTATVTVTGSLWTSLDPNATRLGFGAFGMQLYRSNAPSPGSTLVGEWRTADGSILITGTYRSGLSGQRIHIDPDGTMSFYATAGANPSRITNEGNDVVWRGPLTSGKSGRLNVNTLGVGLNFSNEGNLLSSITSEIVLFDKRARITAPLVALEVTQRFDSPAGDNRLQFSMLDEDGDFITRSGISYGVDGDNWGGFYGNDTGLKFAKVGPNGSGDDGRVVITNGTLGNYGVLMSDGVDAVSSETVKTDIEDARAVIDPLQTVRAARARKFRTVWANPNEAPRIGVIAEELPEVLQRPMAASGGEPLLGIELTSQIGVLWGALGQILDQEIVSTSGTVVLLRSQLGPGGIFPAGGSVEAQVAWDSTPPAAPTGGFAQLHSSFIWAGKVTAWIKTGSVTAQGCTVVFKNISSSPVVVNETSDNLRVSATVIGLGLFTPPYVPLEEA